MKTQVLSAVLAFLSFCVLIVVACSTEATTNKINLMKMKMNEEAPQQCCAINERPFNCSVKNPDCCGWQTMFPACYNPRGNGTSGPLKCCTFYLAAAVCSVKDECCGAQGTGASSAAWCCGGDTPSCCQTNFDGESTCFNPKTEKCCKGYNSFACKLDEHCNTEGQMCCPSSTVTCGPSCCPTSTMYCDGISNRCEWKKGWPTFRPGPTHLPPVPFSPLWHVSKEECAAFQATVDDGTNDFICYSYNFNTSRFSGTSGKRIWTTAEGKGGMTVGAVVLESGIFYYNGLGLDLKTGHVRFNSSDYAKCTKNAFEGPSLYISRGGGGGGVPNVILLCGDKYLHASSTKDGSPTWNFAVNPEDVNSLAENVIAITQNKKLLGLDASTGKITYSVNTGHDLETYGVSRALPQDQKVFFFEDESALEGFSAASGKKIDFGIKDRVPSSDIYCFNLPQHGSVFAYVSKENKTVVVSQETAKVIWRSEHSLPLLPDNENSFSFTSNTHFLYIQFQDGIQAVALSDFKVRWTVEAKPVHGEYSSSIYTSPLSPFLFSPTWNSAGGGGGGPANALRTFSPKSGEILHSIPLLPEETVSRVVVKEGAGSVIVFFSYSVTEYAL